MAWFSLTRRYQLMEIEWRHGEDHRVVNGRYGNADGRHLLRN